MNKKEIFEKHCVLTDGLKRVYVLNTGERHLDMTGSTPVKLITLVSDNWGLKFVPQLSHNPIIHTFEKNSWIELLKELVMFLQKNNPKSKEELLNFELLWTSSKLFRGSKDIANSVKLEEGLYFSFNYSANHSSWVIDELLQLYDIGFRGILLVHRSIFSEPTEVLTVVRQERMDQFQDYLVNTKGLDSEKANKVISSIDGILNRLLVKENHGYNDFFAVDSTNLLSTCKSKLLARLPYITKWSDKQINTAKKYLNYLTSFYSVLEKESRKHKDELNYRVHVL